MSTVVTVSIVVNILSVVGIVIINKYITEVDKYDFMVFLSFLHFFCTMVGTRVMVAMGSFQPASAPMSSVVPVAAGSLLSVAFMNLNLSNNSVGFYQLTLIPITFGVGYSTVYDLSLNLTGAVYATCAVVATSLAQIFTNTYQKSLDCNALQLLYLTSPIISFGMLAMCPIFDDVYALAKFQYTWPCVARIATSCVLALGVNISNYVVLGKTSPLTYQVLGHLKTVLILVLGFTVFSKPLDSRNVIGIIVAMGGVIAYTEVRRVQTSSAPVLPTTSTSSTPTNNKASSS